MLLLCFVMDHVWWPDFTVFCPLDTTRLNSQNSKSRNSEPGRWLEVISTAYLCNLADIWPSSEPSQQRHSYLVVLKIILPDFTVMWCVLKVILFFVICSEGRNNFKARLNQTVSFKHTSEEVVLPNKFICTCIQMEDRKWACLTAKPHVRVSMVWLIISIT